LIDWLRIIWSLAWWSRHTSPVLGLLPCFLFKRLSKEQQTFLLMSPTLKSLLHHHCYLWTKKLCDPQSKASQFFHNSQHYHALILAVQLMNAPLVYQLCCEIRHILGSSLSISSDWGTSAQPIFGTVVFFMPIPHNEKSI
jgi:hypothetical protein